MFRDLGGFRGLGILGRFKGSRFRRVRCFRDLAGSRGLVI